MVLQSFHQNGELEPPFDHFDSRLPELLFHDGQQILRERMWRRCQEFKSKRNAILITNAVSVMIYPSCCIEQLRCTFRIVRPWFDVGIEVRRSWSEFCCRRYAC